VDRALEFTRVHRYVYSVFYGEDFIHHGKPIGYPAGPDSRTVFGEAAGRRTRTGSSRSAAARSSTARATSASSSIPTRVRPKASRCPASSSARAASPPRRAGGRATASTCRSRPTATGSRTRGHVDGLEETRWALRFAARLHK
jgi:hypothetical protein